MVKININLSNRAIYTVLALVIVVLAGVGVYAVAGVSHDASELTGVCKTDGTGCPTLSKWFGTTDIYYDGGKVGIGVSSPQHTLQIGSGTTGVSFGLKGHLDGGPTIIFEAQDTSNRFTIDADLDGSTVNDLLKFNSITSDNILVLKGDGNVGIGTSNPAEGYKLDVAGNIKATKLYAATEVHVGSANYPFIKFYTVDGHKVTVGMDSPDGNKFKISRYGTGQFVISNSGDITGTHGTYHVSSDIRNKKEIVTIPNALEKTLALRGINFKWKDGSDGASLQMGLISQEVEKVVPEVVHTSNDDMQIKSVEYPFLVSLLIEAIKEQQQQIEELRNIICSNHPEVEFCN